MEESVKTDAPRNTGGLEVSELELDRMGEDMRLAARRAEVVSDLSSEALKGWYISSLLNAAVRLTAEAMGADVCGVFKLERSGDALKLVAGVGWPEGAVASALVGAEAESQVGYTVRAGKPIVSEDLTEEERFSPSSLLKDLGARSGLSVPMIAGSYVFGAMSAHTAERRSFSRADISFLETVANILTIAALRRQAVVALRHTYRGLKETKRYLSNVVETSTDAIVSTDGVGDVVLFNNEAQSVLKYQREEMVGNPASILFERRDQADEILRQTRESGGIVSGLKIMLLTKDGEAVPALTAASIFYGDKGEEKGAVFFNRDLRERKRWEDEIEKVTREIETTQNALEQAQSEADAAGELRRQMELTQKAQKKLVMSEKMAALGRLTAGVAHEILNPLNVISLTLHVMLQDPDLPEELERNLKVVNLKAEHISKIVTGLHDYVGSREPKRVKLDLNELVERTIHLLTYDLRAANITVVQSLSRGLPVVRADREQLVQVVLNLLSNALDAMPDGGQLNLRTAEVERSGARFVELRVEDTGVGIGDGEMDKIFDPFFTTKPEGEGQGLGLAICQGIVEGHGGSISAESAKGKGTTLVVRLPAWEEE